MKEYIYRVLFEEWLLVDGCDSCVLSSYELLDLDGQPLSFEDTGIKLNEDMNIEIDRNISLTTEFILRGLTDESVAADCATIFERDPQISFNVEIVGISNFQPYFSPPELASFVLDIDKPETIYTSVAMTDIEEDPISVSFDDLPDFLEAKVVSDKFTLTVKDGV